MAAATWDFLSASTRPGANAAIAEVTLPVERAPVTSAGSRMPRASPAPRRRRRFFLSLGDDFLSHQNGQNPNDVSLSSARTSSTSTSPPLPTPPSHSAPHRTARASHLWPSPRASSRRLPLSSRRPRTPRVTPRRAPRTSSGRVFLCVPARASDGVVASGATERASSSSSASRIAGPTRGGTVSPAAFGSRPFAPAVVPVSVAAPAGAGAPRVGHQRPDRRVLLRDDGAATAWFPPRARPQRRPPARRARSRTSARTTPGVARTPPAPSGATLLPRPRDRALRQPRRYASLRFLEHAPHELRTPPPGHGPRHPGGRSRGNAPSPPIPPTRAPRCAGGRVRAVGTSRDFVTSTFVAVSREKEARRRVWPVL